MTRVRRLRGHLRGLTVLVGMAAVGCGGDASSPIRPGVATPPPAEGTPHLMVILPTTNAVDLEIIREVAGDLAREGGSAYIYREGIVRTGMPASQQASVIREAVDKGASALLVVAADRDAIAPTLTEVREQGIAVVLIGDDVPVDGEPLPLVTFPPLEEAARQLVSALQAEAQQSELPPDTRAVILTNTGPEWHLQDGVGALETALAEADISLARVVPFEKTALAAREALATALDEDLTIGLVLFDDHLGAEGAALAAHDLDRTVLFGGFVAQLDAEQAERLGNAVGLVNRNVPRLTEQAVRTALQLLNQEPVPERIEVEPTFHRGADTLQSPGQ